MKIHTFRQGDAAWHQHRASARNASDAAAVMGCHLYVKRSELLHQRHTGLRPEVEAPQQKIFDAGHAIEAAQRAGAVLVIGEDLFPVVGSAVVEGIELSASFDGLTMLEDVAYECKSLNDDLRSALPHADADANDARRLPLHYRVQMEQQLAVCNGERVLFVAANKDGSDVRRCWYLPDPALRAQLIAAWKQFDADLAAYAPEARSVERVVAEPVEALPAPVVQVSGQLALSDNFKVFEERLRHFLAHRLIREPKTDEDFVNLDAQIKAMKQGRDALKAARAQMLAQVQPIDQAAKTADMLDTLLQQNCSMAERLLKDEKERRRGEIVAAGLAALREHVAALNARLGKPYLAPVACDFAAAIKGLKSLASMDDKVAGELARAKIAANEAADRIDVNLKALRELAGAHAFLFADTAALVQKAPEDCRAVISARIAEHQAAEEKRLEAERARIRAEEAARLEREQQQREREAARQAAEAARALPPAAAPVAPMAPSAPAVAPAPVVVAMRAAEPGATLRLGQINERIAPLQIDASGLARLGFQPVAVDKAAKLYPLADLPRILAACIAHLQALANPQQAA